MIVSTKIAEMFKHCGFVNVDYLVENKLERNPSKILNILNRDWRKWVKPVCMKPNLKSLDPNDPNFGYTTAGGSYVTRAERIIGSVFTITEAGTADSITAYVDETYTRTYKYGIYKHDDLSFVGETESRTPAGGVAKVWRTLYFSAPKPSLEANTAHILVSKAHKYGGNIYYDAGDTDQGHYQAISWSDGEPAWSNPLVPTHDNNKYSIYCTYTTEVAVAKKVMVDGFVSFVS